MTSRECPQCGAGFTVAKPSSRKKCCSRECAHKFRADRQRVPAAEALLERIELRDDGCWAWAGPVSKQGYAHFRGTRAHRIAYESWVGPIPEGLVIDHICHKPESCALGDDCPHRCCVNPAHLQPTTRKVNGGPGRSSWASVTRCKNGHEFTPENTYYTPSRRQRHCRQCGIDRTVAYHKRNWERKLQYQREYRARKREQMS